jgi:hypothetical protein
MLTTGSRGVGTGEGQEVRIEAAILVAHDADGRVTVQKSGERIHGHRQGRRVRPEAGLPR